MKKLILSVLLFLLVASSTGCTILNDSQSSIENDDKLIIDQTSTKNTSDVLIQALETNDAELFKSVFSEQTLKLQPTYLIYLRVTNTYLIYLRVTI